MNNKNDFRGLDHLTTLQMFNLSGFVKTSKTNSSNETAWRALGILQEIVRLCPNIHGLLDLEGLESKTSTGQHLIWILNTLEVYHEQIVRLYEKVCGGDISKIILLLLAYEANMPNFTKEKIAAAIDKGSPDLNLEKLSQEFTGLIRKFFGFRR